MEISAWEKAEAEKIRKVAQKRLNEDASSAEKEKLVKPSTTLFPDEKFSGVLHAIKLFLPKSFLLLQDFNPSRCCFPSPCQAPTCHDEAASLHLQVLSALS